MNTKIKAGIAAAAMLLCTAAFSGCGAVTVDLNDYLTVDFDGYDTVGKAKASVDIDSLLRDNAEALKIDEDDFVAAFTAYDDFYSKLEGTLDKKEELSNGDKVKFTWDDIDTKKFKEKYSIKLKFSDEEFVVSGLEEAEEFNPFDYIKVTYEGFAPYGKLNISKEGNMPVSVSYEADKADHLGNGDKVLIKAVGYDDFEEYCLSRGYIPTATEQEFTVSGLASYAGSLGDIPTDAFDKMDAHAQDTLNAYVAKNWAKSETFKGMKLIGNYFLTPKDPSISTDTYNYIYYIYKVTATNVDTETDFDYYFYARYDSIILLEDGTCSFDLSSIDYPQSGWFTSYDTFKVGGYVYAGYEDIDTLFNKLVTSKIDKYSYETTVDE